MTVQVRQVSQLLKAAICCPAGGALLRLPSAARLRMWQGNRWSRATSCIFCSLMILDDEHGINLKHETPRSFWLLLLKCKLRFIPNILKAERPARPRAFFKRLRACSERNRICTGGSAHAPQTTCKCTCHDKHVHTAICAATAWLRCYPCTPHTLARLHRLRLSFSLSGQELTAGCELAN